MSVTYLSGLYSNELLLVVLVAPGVEVGTRFHPPDTRYVIVVTTSFNQDLHDEKKQGARTSSEKILCDSRRDQRGIRGLSKNTVSHVPISPITTRFSRILALVLFLA